MLHYYLQALKHIGVFVQRSEKNSKITHCNQLMGIIVFGVWFRTLYFIYPKHDKEEIIIYKRSTNVNRLCPVSLCVLYSNTCFWTNKNIVCVDNKKSHSIWKVRAKHVDESETDWLCSCPGFFLTFITR